MPFISPEKMHIVPGQPGPKDRVAGQQVMQSSGSCSAGKCNGKRFRIRSRTIHQPQDFIGRCPAYLRQTSYDDNPESIGIQRG
jgi:hypothetical protein